MTAITAGALLAICRDRLDESTARQWSDAYLYRLINEAAKDIARKTESLEDRQSIAAVVTPVTSEYSLAANCIRVNSVEFVVTAEGRKATLAYAGTPQNMANFGWSDISTRQDAHPYAYTTWGSGTTLKLIVYPAPALAGTFTVWYYRLPVALATDGSASATEVEIPQAWDNIAADYVEFRALRQDRDPRWIEAKQMYDDNLAAMYDGTRSWVDQANLIVPASGGGSLPRWLTDDGGLY